jgi:DNA-3-methyladenine glycosylase
MSLRPVPKSLDQKRTEIVARELLGCVLQVFDSESSEWIGGRIVETEAYSGEDPSSHSARGQTPRNAPMFEAPGHAYVYFIYGMYEMLNITTERVGQPGAVLIRALEPIEPLSMMRSRRPDRTRDWDLCSGPGKLTRALSVTRADNRARVGGERLRILTDGRKTPIFASPRVGIREGRDTLWRFFIESRSVSRVRENESAQRISKD